MIGKKSRPVIGKLAGSFGSGNRAAGFTDVVTSPRSPLELKIQSPRGVNSYDLGGVGLGIVAALDKSGGGGQIQITKAVCGLNLNRSNPIPVNSVKNSSRFRGEMEEMETDSLENYTYVTCHGPNKSYTRVYWDGDEYSRNGHDRIDFDRSKELDVGVFAISPARLGEDNTRFTASDFLSSCHLCQKKLHGKDIYMYRGEKAFCSTECRYRQIMKDERKEQCSSKASRSATDVSNSPCSNTQIFSNGILAI